MVSFGVLSKRLPVNKTELKSWMCKRRSFCVAALTPVQRLFASDDLPTRRDLSDLTIESVSALIHKKRVSPVEPTYACLRRIEEFNPRINAFITVMAKTANEQAAKLELEMLHGGWRGPLHGIPMAIKDNIDTAGVKTTCASALFANRIPEYDAEVVSRLKSAGAIILGKLNMHEFAHGTTSVISHYGPVHNPWNRDHIAGGSSGGAGAAVAARLCYGAVGTDTGASIRAPAACCGIVGLKPTYGLVSTRGVVPDSWSFDHVGPMCRTAADTAIMLSCMAGYDPEDGASIAGALATTCDRHTGILATLGSAACSQTKQGIGTSRSRSTKP